MALQRTLRRVFATALAVCAIATTSSTPASTVLAADERAAQDGDDVFDEIHRRAAPLERSLQTISASFVETSTSTLLKEPQVSRGTVVARRPNDVRLEYARPDARTVIIRGHTLSLDWPSRKMHGTRDVGAMMRRASRFFGETSPAELRKHFDIAAAVASDRKGTWHVTFTPRRKQMREGVAKVHLWIDQSSLVLQAMKMDYAGGDSRLMEFADIRINPPVADDAFTLPTAR